jgi:hypothetical protein
MSPDFLLILRRRLLVAALITALSAPCAQAGKLEGFENEATRLPIQVDGAGHPVRGDDDKSCSCLMDVIDAFVSVFTHGTQDSWERSAPASEDVGMSDMISRQTGAPQIPIFRVDGNYQSVESDVDAFDWRVEGGFGPLALGFRRTQYSETSPSDDLDLTQFFGLLRLWFGGEVEVDVGVGALAINGEAENSGLAFTLPISYRPVDWCGVEFRPVWATVNGNNTRDYDVGLSLGVRYVCLRGGYRWMESGAASLNGPYVGISVQF